MVKSRRVYILPYYWKSPSGRFVWILAYEVANVRSYCLSFGLRVTEFWHPKFSIFHPRVSPFQTVRTTLLHCDKKIAIERQTASVKGDITLLWWWWSLAALQVDEQKWSAVKSGNTKIDVRVTSSDDDVMTLYGRACAVASSGSVLSGMPATCSPTITLLQKRRGSRGCVFHLYV